MAHATDVSRLRWPFGRAELEVPVNSPREAQPEPALARGRVIWITGYSSAGKTTVARKVAERLRQLGHATVFLDADDLRRIFASKWGYAREERLELSLVYLRLCSHLAAQDVTVVMAAVAMYDEAYAWFRRNVAGALQVYLKVPERERLRRDRASKNVYQRISAADLGYGEPQADLVIENHGETSVDATVSAIVRHHLEHAAKPPVDLDHGKNAHWEAHYRGREGCLEPSPFAHHVGETLGPRPLRLLDVGCGDGRDSAYFRRLGHDVTAIDASPAAIALCERGHPGLGITFRHGAVDDLADRSGPASFDVVYCRFTMHAMTDAEEAAFRRGAHALLTDDGRLFIECRSVNDIMMRRGEVISPTERIHGHYRRFIVLDELVDRLGRSGFEIESAIESTGLAVFDDEDPTVIRVMARRRNVR